MNIKQTTHPEVLICDCHSTEHQIVIDYDEEDGFTYCHIHLTRYGFWRRLKAGLRYIFGYKCKFGHWDEFILTDQHIEQLVEINKSEPTEKEKEGMAASELIDKIANNKL